MARDATNNIKATLGRVVSTIRQALIPRGLSHNQVLWAIRIFAALAVVVVILGLLVRFGFVTSEDASLIGALIALTGVVISQVVSTHNSNSSNLKRLEIETRRAHAQQELETSRAQAYRFQSYLERMEKLVVAHQLRKANEASGEDSDEAHEARIVAQAQTLAALEGESDPTRKRILLLFLYDSALIDKANPILTLARANLSRVDLSEARLKGANLIGANLSGANLREAHLIAANLREVRLEGANLTEAYLREASLIAADLSRADLSRADLIAANLREARLEGANLIGANLSGANLSAAHLTAADLNEAKLSGAKLSGAWLRDANLSRVNLTEAHLGVARLEGATLSGANLSGANLFGAHLHTANLFGVKNLTQEQINEADGDQTTQLPDYLQRPAHWGKSEKEKPEES